MEQRFYHLMLIRLLGLPIIALVLLAAMLGFGLKGVEKSAQMMDHSDRIIAQANLISKQMIDQETGLRGFLITQSPVFLQPMREANEHLDANLSSLQQMVNNRPEQVGRIKHLQALHTQWEAEAAREIANPSQSATVSNMLAR